MQRAAVQHGCVPAMPFDFSELCVTSLRRLLPAWHRRGLACTFDFHGPAFLVNCDALSFSCCLQRLLCGLADLIDDGFLLIDLKASSAEEGQARFCIRLAGSGSLADSQTLAQTLARLQIVVHTSEDDGGVQRGCGRCPRTGGLVQFASQRETGAMIAMDLLLPATPMEPTAGGEAGAARAWIVDAHTMCAETLVRRLQRGGWATTRFESVAQAARHLETSPPGTAKPALILVCESSGIDIAGLAAFSSTLPHWSHLVYAAPMGSSAFVHHHRFDVDVMPLPLGQADLDDMRSRLSPWRDPHSGRTRPAPLLFADRPTLLIVDDNEVNLLVGSGLAQAAGFEVCVASGGLHAIDLCRRLLPDVVLMDINMPDCDGLEATRRLRALQARGDLAPSVIIALTADVTQQEACINVGMDGFLSKPLQLDALCTELQRLCIPRTASRLGQPLLE